MTCDVRSDLLEHWTVICGQITALQRVGSKVKREI